MSCQRKTKLAAMLISVFIAGCSRLSAQTNEVVMCPGGSLVVDIGDTSFAIKSTGLLTREVETDHSKRAITLVPRVERWFGSFGLYNAEAGDAQTHVIMEEGFQHFSSIDELQYWIVDTRRKLPLAYTSDGLVVAGLFQTRPPGTSGGPNSAMTINVWRFLIDGAPPVGLAGADDTRFKNIALPPPTCSKPRPFAASPAKVINGRRYAGRAIDFMNEQGFTPTDVEQIIKTGRRTEEGGRIMFYDSSPNHASHIFFVDTRADGSVVQIG